MDVGLQNDRMGALIIDQLIAHGVTTFCIAPGSRSTPLTLAVARHARAKVTIHFDERGLCFYALGIAKATQKPVAVIVTSGTAVGNLLPAVMESSNAHVPLILLTSDRPQELRDCSANQTLDQVKLFANFVRMQTDLLLSDRDFPPQYVVSTIGQAVSLSQSPLPGPVHLNCMLREPLFSPSPLETCPLTPSIWEMAEMALAPHLLETWAERLRGKRGVIIAGALPHTIQPQPIFELAERLGWPIFADVLSQLRACGSSPYLISCADSLLRAKFDEQLDAVLHIGDRFVSKTVAEWLKNKSPPLYLHVATYHTRHDPLHLVTHRLQASPDLFARQIAPFFEREPKASLWSEGQKRIEAALDEFFSQRTEISEPSIAYDLGGLAREEIALFFANSMPIRDANLFFSPRGTRGPIFGNRGVSGIDGNIATAVGIAQGLKKPLIAVLGDLSFLHDLNSLALIKQAEYPVSLIVINNGGGGIFSFLPIAQQKEVFETFWATPHSYSFAQAAALFDIPYTQITERRDLFADCKSQIIEVRTDRAENVKLHEQITKVLNESCLPARVFG